MPSLWIVWIIFQECGYTSVASSEKSQISFAPKTGQLSLQNCKQELINAHDELNWSLKAIDYAEYQQPKYSKRVECQLPTMIKDEQQRLQYIDYKIHYGLRYNPPASSRKTSVQNDPSSANATGNAIKSVYPNTGKPIWGRKKLDLHKPPNRLADGWAVSMQHNPPVVPLLSIINIITFSNGPCVARNIPISNQSFNTNWTGICYQENECRRLKGTPMDTCAGGFGVCCVFQHGCETRTKQNISYFLSPNFPDVTTEALPCSFTLSLHPSARQVLLEFIFFELQPPQLGNCVEDQFIISVQNDHRNYPILCGINSGQHMYLDIDRAYSHLLYLNAVFGSHQPRAFLIKITQFVTPRAPMNCLQFHEGLTGEVKSFNYDNHSTLVKNLRASYFNNLNYAICIRRHLMFCDVVFLNENILGNENIFQIINVSEDGSSLLLPGQAGAETFSCPDDYITINYIRLCGEKLNDGTIVADFTLNTPISYTSAGPILIAVRSDQSTVGRGFLLAYRQHVCTT